MGFENAFNYDSVYSGLGATAAFLAAQYYRKKQTASGSGSSGGAGNFSTPGKFPGKGRTTGPPPLKPFKRSMNRGSKAAEESRPSDRSRVIRNKSGIKSVGDNTTTNVINNVGIQSTIERPISMVVPRDYKQLHLLPPWNPLQGQAASVKLQFRWEATSVLNKRNPFPIFIRHNQSGVALDDVNTLSPVQITRVVNVQDSSTTAKGVEIDSASRVAYFDPDTGQPNYLVVPLNIYNLENISWNLNPLKITTSPNNLNPNTDVPKPVGEKRNVLCLGDAPTYDPSDPDSYSPSYSFFPNNAQSTQGSTLSPDVVAQNPPFMCQLNGGYFRQVFQNNLATPCVIEIVAYTYRDTTCVDGDATNMYNDVVDTIGDAWVNHQKTFVASNYTAGGHEWTPEDILTDPKYPFLPSTLAKEYEFPARFKETSRIKFELGGGNRRQLTINLPAAHYDPVYTNSLRSSTTFQYKHQLQVMLMVSLNGVKMPSFPQYAAARSPALPVPPLPDVWFSQTTNLSNVLVDLGYAPASVSVFGEYVERIGPCYPTKVDPFMNIRGFLNPASVGPNSVTATVPEEIPQCDIVSGYILDPAQTVRTTLSDVVPVNAVSLIT